MTKLSTLDRLDDELRFHALRLQTARAALLVLPASVEAIGKLLVLVEEDGHLEDFHESINDITDAMMMLNALLESTQDLQERVDDLIFERKHGVGTEPGSEPERDVVSMHSGASIRIAEDA